MGDVKIQIMQFSGDAKTARKFIAAALGDEDSGAPDTPRSDNTSRIIGFVPNEILEDEDEEFDEEDD